jgi:creatinine amidohydrolase
MLLQHALWQDVEGYLKRSRGVVVPTGSTEQHGPIGWIGTDALCAEGVAQALSDAQDVLVGPTIAFGPAQFNLDFPGTISLRASTMMALVRDYVSSLTRQGFTHFYFLNGHGANIAPLRAAFHDLHLDFPDVRCRLRSWWELPAVDRLRKSLYGDGEGMHATPSEIALVQALHEDAPRVTDLPPPPRLPPQFLRDHAGDQHWHASVHRADFPDGRVGSDSSQARPEHGDALLEAAVTDAWQDYQTFLEEA